LWWNVCNISVLMAIKLKNASVCLLFSPLSLEGVHKIINIHIKSHDSLSIIKSSTRVSSDLLSVVSNNGLMDLEIVLSLLDSHGNLKNFNSESLNGDNLIRVNVNLAVEEFL